MSSKQINDDDITEKDDALQNDNKENPQDDDLETSFSSGVGSNSRVPVRLGEDSTLNLSKMYQNWFLDYA